MRRASRAIIIKDDSILVTKRNKFGDEYYILIGGGIDMGETEEQALLRELHEESGVQVANPHKVFVENAGDMYGFQHIFLCDYVSGEPALHPDSTEAKINTMDIGNGYEMGNRCRTYGSLAFGLIYVVLAEAFKDAISPAEAGL